MTVSIYSVALPRGAVGCSAVCDCGISLSYSLTFCPNNLFTFLCSILARNTSLTSSCVDPENAVRGPDNL